MGVYLGEGAFFKKSRISTDGMALGGKENRRRKVGGTRKWQNQITSLYKKKTKEITSSLFGRRTGGRREG